MTPSPPYTDAQIERAADAFLYEMAAYDLKVVGSGYPVDWHRQAMRAALETLDASLTQGGDDGEG